MFINYWTLTYVQSRQVSFRNDILIFFSIASGWGGVQDTAQTHQSAVRFEGNFGSIRMTNKWGTFFYQEVNPANFFFPQKFWRPICLLCFASRHNDTVSLLATISRFTCGSVSLCRPHSHAHNTHTQYCSACGYHLSTFRIVNSPTSRRCSVHKCYMFLWNTSRCA